MLMEQEEKGPVCKRTSGKRRRHDNVSKRTSSASYLNSSKKESYESAIEDVFSLTNTSSDSLFDESIHLSDDNSNNFIKNIDCEKQSEDNMDDSLSEYFFLSSTQDKSRENIVCHTPTHDIKPDLSCSKGETENIKSSGLDTSRTIVEVVHSDLNMSSNNRHLEIDTKAVETPSTAGKIFVVNSSSIKDKLKKRLLGNVGSVTVQKNVEENVRNEAIFQAQLDASQIRKEGSSVDIGPFYGLPAKVQQLFEKYRGISKFYDWQDECLKLEAVKEHRNLIYTLPTSGGKTLVAEVLIMRELLCYQRDALLVLPFVSIVQEKVKTISEFATELGFLVEEYAGSKGRFPPIRRREKKSLYIATIEKAHSLVNSLIDTNRMESLGLVVVDELHMVGEGGSRGATLESILLKLILKSEAQIVGMSATLNNIKDLQTFLHAEHFTNDFRPVTLKEYIKVEDNIFKVNRQMHEEEPLEHDRIVTFPYSSELLKQDPDHLLGLVMEILPENSCLMFCATKKHCENVALMLSKLINKSHRHLASIKEDKKKQLLAELSQDGEGNMCPVLKYTIQFGIAYHHSGLTADERRLIEDAYSDGILCLLACTSTLAAGVNLPAKRVILRSPYVGMSFIKYSQYKQMTGRAGRAGIDTSGESILIMKAQDKAKVKDLLAGPKDLCHSSLAYDGMKGIKSLLLSAVGLKIVTSTKSAFDLMNQSLLHIQASALDVDVTTATRESLQYLIDQELVVCKSRNPCDESDAQDSLCVSSLGQATFKGAVDQDFITELYRDLQTAIRSLNVVSHLHLLYLVTPYDVAVNIDWNIYLNQYYRLTEAELKVPDLIGITERYISLKAAGHTVRKKTCERAVNRFYVTLMLWDLYNQKSIWEVADRFSQPRGFVQNLLSQSVAFASSVFHFCQ
ncbi:unnamed protein product, partial [Candidula unifasciata]